MDITIKLNNEKHIVKKDTSLAVFIEGLKIRTQGIAIAIDYNVIPRNKWNDTILSDNMELMLIQAVSGG